MKILTAWAVLLATQITGFVPVTDAVLEKPDPGDWLMWRRTLDGWGYSPLEQISGQNVGQLTIAWTRDMATDGIQEAAPLAYKGTLFVPNPSDATQAIDGATGNLIWEYRRPVPLDLTKYMSGAPFKNRNFAIYRDTIIDLSVDDYVYALDARTGTPIWQTQIQDYRTLPAIQGSGPIVARGKIFSGRACDYRYSNDGCVITAHDAATGKELWRFRTIPRPGEPGVWEMNLGSPVNGFRVTYTANGKQFVAVSTGTSVVSAGISRLAPELKQGSANRLYAFSLP